MEISKDASKKIPWIVSIMQRIRRLIVKKSPHQPLRRFSLAPLGRKATL